MLIYLDVEQRYVHYHALKRSVIQKKVSLKMWPIYQMASIEIG